MPNAVDSPQAPPESVLRLIALAIGWSLLAGVSGGIAAVVAGAFGLNVKDPALPSDLGHPAKELAIMAAYGVWFFAVFVRSRVVGDGDVRRGLGYEPISRPILIALIAIVIAGYGFLLDLRFFLIRSDLLTRELAIAVESPWLSVSVALNDVVLGPLAEELLFRGWLWTGLRKHWGAVSTATFTGTAFLALHVSAKVYILAMILPVAIILSLARHFGRSVRASIALHMLYNFTIEISPWALKAGGLI